MMMVRVKGCNSNKAIMGLGASAGAGADTGRGGKWTIDL